MGIFDFSSEKGGTFFGGGREKGIGYGKRHKGKRTGGIGKPKPPKIPKPPKPSKSPKVRKGKKKSEPWWKRDISRKDKRIGRRVLRKLI